MTAEFSDLKTCLDQLSKQVGFFLATAAVDVVHELAINANSV